MKLHEEGSDHRLARFVLVVALATVPPGCESVPDPVSDVLGKTDETDEQNNEHTGVVSGIIGNVARGIPRVAFVSLESADGSPLSVKVAASLSQESLDGIQSLREEKWLDAIRALEAAVLTDTDDHESYFALGVTHEKLGDLESAIADYERAAFLKATERYGQGAARAKAKRLTKGPRD